jgi:type VI secretion system protein ImpE
MDGRELYRAGKLGDAIAAMNEEVKKNPLDTARRGFLAELLCAAGNFERADKMLEALGVQEPLAVPTIALFRQCIRAEQARQQLWTDGRVPDLLGDATPVVRLLLEAVVATREGRAADALRLVAEAEEVRPKPKGTCDGKPFDDFRDLDDMTSAVFEVLTSTGKYFWIPVDRVESVEFRAPARPRDLLWRRAHMIVKDGPDGEVYVPAVYAGIAEADESARLGRSTDWRGGDTSPVRGVGQRTLLVGEEARPILEITNLVFEVPASS